MVSHPISIHVGTLDEALDYLDDVNRLYCDRCLFECSQLISAELGRLQAIEQRVNEVAEWNREAGRPDSMVLAWIRTGEK